MMNGGSRSLRGYPWSARDGYAGAEPHVARSSAANGDSPYQVSHSVQRLQDAIHAHLSDNEKEMLLESLNDFNATYDARNFVYRLLAVLDTPAKWHMVSLIRAIIPSSELEKFDYAMWTCSVSRRWPSPEGAPYSQQRSADWYHTAPGRMRPSSDQAAREPGQISMVHLRPQAGRLGFEVTSGTGSRAGVCVLRVEPMSQAEENGLRPGDLILEANDIDFSMVSQADAEKVLHAARSLSLTVKRSQLQHLQHWPPQTTRGGLQQDQGPVQSRLQSFTWVDHSGRPTSPPPDYGSINGHVFGDAGYCRKVSLALSRKGSLGITIRGGAEHGLGIYVSAVDQQSAGELAGIQVGDRIVDVNGRSFEGLTHKDAVKVLRRHQHLVLTLVYTGKLPQSKRSAHVHRSASLDKSHYPGSLGRRDKTGNEHLAKKRSSSQTNLISQLSRSMRGLDLLEERGQTLLSQSENDDMRHCIEQYLHGALTVDQLVTSLSGLFNTYAKLPMYSEVKSTILPQHIQRYEWLVMQKEVNMLKLNSDVQEGHVSDASTTGSSQSERSTNGRSAFRQGTTSAGAVSKAFPFPDGNRNDGRGSRATAEFNSSRRSAKTSKGPRMLPLQSASDALGDTTTTDDEDVYNGSLSRPRFSTGGLFSTDQSSVTSQLSAGVKSAENRAKGDFLMGPQQDSSSSHSREAQRESRQKIIDTRSRGHAAADAVYGVPDTDWKPMPLPNNAIKSQPPPASWTAQEKPRDVSLRSRQVRVHKTLRTLGLAIEGGSDTRQPLPKVASIQDTGCAHASELQCGDTILQVNGRSLEGLAHEAVARLIAEAFRTKDTAYIDFVVLNP